MNCFGVGDLGRRNDCGHIEIAQPRRRRPDADRFIREFYVFGVGVGLRVNDNGLNPELAAGALNPQGNLTAIGNQNFFKKGHEWIP